MVGKIFIARIYFTDFSTYKDRPILIIKEYLKEDFLYLPITSNLNLKGFAISNEILETGEIFRPSAIIISKIGIIHKSLLKKEIATLKQSIFKKVIELVCKDLGC